MDIAHFAFGAAMTSLVVTFLVPTVRYPRTLVAVGGGWAMLPDVHRIAPIGAARLRELHGSVWADACWFHRTLDQLDPSDSEEFAALLLGLFLVATLVGERRSYRAPSRLQESVYGESAVE